MLSLLQEQGVKAIDGLVMDIGVSSMQIDQAERGFSFRQDGPLDMRMSQKGISASVLVNTLPEKELADIFYTYGEEKASRKIAAAIVQAREATPIETTAQLANIGRSVVRKTSDMDPATRTFQALRIKVNDELGELQRALEDSPRLLAAGGRLIVVTFHSLEDRIVKKFMRPSGHAASRHDMAALVQQQEEAGLGLFDLPTRKAILADAEEIRVNPRARSAKMRVAVRTAAPVNVHEELHD
jgi:16S rRNA (cytosine1402-N4)-methyltransferase